MDLLFFLLSKIHFHFSTDCLFPPSRRWRSSFARQTLSFLSLRFSIFFRLLLDLPPFQRIIVRSPPSNINSAWAKFLPDPRLKLYPNPPRNGWNRKESLTGEHGAAKFPNFPGRMTRTNLVISWKDKSRWLPVTEENRRRLERVILLRFQQEWVVRGMFQRLFISISCSFKKMNGSIDIRRWKEWSLFFPSANSYLILQDLQVVSCRYLYL